MDDFTLSLIANSIQLVIFTGLSFYIIYNLIKDSRGSGARILNKSMPVKVSLISMYFTLGLLCLLIGNLYWFIIINLDPDGGMRRFSAVDIAAISSFLLWSASIQNLNVVKEKKINWKVIIEPVIFGLVNTWWWIYFSGMWGNNIIWCIVIVPYSGQLACVLHSTGCLKGLRMFSIRASLFIVVVAMFINMYAYNTNEKLYYLTDHISFAAWVAALVFLEIYAFRSGKKEAYLLSLFANLIATYGEFMTEKAEYSIMICMVTLTTVITGFFFMRIRKEE